MALTGKLGTVDSSLVGSTITAGYAPDTGTFETVSSTMSMGHVVNVEVALGTSHAMTIVDVAVGLVTPAPPTPPLIIVEGKVQQGSDIKQSGVRVTRFLTTNYTTTSDDSILVCNAALTITLIDAALVFGKEYDIKNMIVGTIIVDGFNTQLIDDSLTQLLTAQYDSLTISSIGSGWIIL